jgi:hypothetical protein
VTLSVVKVFDLKRVSSLVRARCTIIIKRPVDGRPSFAEHKQALFFCTGEFATSSSLFWSRVKSGAWQQEFAVFLALSFGD